MSGNSDYTLIKPKQCPVPVRYCDHCKLSDCFFEVSKQGLSIKGIEELKRLQARQKVGVK